MKYIIIVGMMLGGIILQAEDNTTLHRGTYCSSNQKYCLEVTPKGFNNNDSSCMGVFYETDSIVFNKAIKWSRHLMNPIGPAFVCITNNGYVITFDDWDNAGYGDRIIVIYGLDGSVIRNFSLEELVPNDEIRKMKISNNNRRWRFDYRIDDWNNQLRVQTIINDKDSISNDSDYRLVIIDLNDGKLISSNKYNDLPDINSFIPVEIPAKPIKYAHPGYPEMARKKGQQGTVYVKMLVDLDGTIMHVIVFKSSGYPELDSEAVKAAYKTLFESAQIQGKPVRVWVAMPIHFKLD